MHSRVLTFCRSIHAARVYGRGDTIDGHLTRLGSCSLASPQHCMLERLQQQQCVFPFHHIRQLTSPYRLPSTSSRRTAIRPRLPVLSEKPRSPSSSSLLAHCEALARRCATEFRGDRSAFVSRNYASMLSPKTSTGLKPPSDRTPDPR